MMEVKKFEAPTLAEALQVIKRELGPDAVILSTKNNRSGFGLMNRGSVEVTAVVNSETLQTKKHAESKLSGAQLAALYQKPGQKINNIYDVLSGNRLERKIEEQASRSTFGTAPKTSPKGQASAPSTQQNSSTSNQQYAKINSHSSHQITQRRYIDISDDDSPAEMASASKEDRTRIATPQSTLMDRARAQSSNAQASAYRQNLNHGSQNSTSANQSPNHAAMAFQSLPTPTVNVPKIQGQMLPRLLAQLIDAGVDQDIVRELGDELKLIIVKEQINREEVARAHLGRLLMARLRVAKPLSERLRVPTTPRMIAFVGPTGVGKTTTIAKIAAELVINQRQPVVLATTDTFKIAAIDQLQTYANILKIQLEVCPTAEALAALQTNISPDAVVLIDTAGFGPRDESKLFELKDVLSAVRAETHLCVGAMTRDRDISDIVKRFKLFEPNYLVMTKLDETSCFGGILNVSVKSHLPLSYFTMGQRVPEDMEVATKERVADLLLNISGGI